MLNPTKRLGWDITVTPPASASEHSPARNALQARCNATIEEEQAVSTVSVGPSRPKKYATRPDTMLPALLEAMFPWPSLLS